VPSQGFRLMRCQFDGLVGVVRERHDVGVQFRIAVQPPYPQHSAVGLDCLCSSGLREGATMLEGEGCIGGARLAQLSTKMRRSIADLERGGPCNPQRISNPFKHHPILPVPAARLSSTASIVTIAK
jgi:hypothetical protein